MITLDFNAPLTERGIWHLGFKAEIYRYFKSMALENDNLLSLFFDCNLPNWQAQNKD